MSSAENLEETLASRIRTYLGMVSKALKQISIDSLGSHSKALEVLNLAKLYRDDAEYYLNVGDLPTALACISYAEGLLDALKIMGLINISWTRERPKKVLVAGTFDIIHAGHIRFLREAWKLGLVYAVVARDRNVQKFKGRLPIMPEDMRLEVVSSIKYVYKALLGDDTDLLKPVERVKPDIIFLGPDQPMDEESLKRELERRGIKAEVRRMSRREGPEIASSTSIIKEILRRYCDSNITSDKQ